MRVAMGRSHEGRIGWLSDVAVPFYTKQLFPGLYYTQVPAPAAPSIMKRLSRALARSVRGISAASKATQKVKVVQQDVEGEDEMEGGQQRQQKQQKQPKQQQTRQPVAQRFLRNLRRRELAGPMFSYADALMTLSSGGGRGEGGGGGGGQDLAEDDPFNKFDARRFRAVVDPLYWRKGQLEKQVAEGSWILASSGAMSTDVVFPLRSLPDNVTYATVWSEAKRLTDGLWSDILKSMGGEYSEMAKLTMKLKAVDYAYGPYAKADSAHGGSGGGGGDDDDGDDFYEDDEDEDDEDEEDDDDEDEEEDGGEDFDYDEDERRRW